MSNPFLVGLNSNSYSGTTTPVSSSYTGGSSTGGTGSIWTGASAGAEGVSKTGSTKTGASSYQQDLNDVAAIGAEKRAGFENGLGGTNNPDDHQLFLTA